MARWIYWAGAGVVVVALAVQMARPVGAASLTTTVKAPTEGSKLQMEWPSGPESYLALSSGGTVGSHGPNQAIPVGSVTKMMTAYLLLQKHPLSYGSQGPMVAVTSQDAAEYRHDLASHQSVAKVSAGEKLSEKKILEGILVASGNNIAHIAADWISGSSKTFTQMMNQEAQKLGMHHTHFVGPSGLNPGSVSTPRDETILAEKAMQNPIFRQIVGMPQVFWGHSGHAIENFNYVVGHDGITGVKTGSTVLAGGCFVFSAPRTVGSHVVTIYGAVLGQAGKPHLPQLQYALNDGESLINQLSAQMKSVYMVRSGQHVATLKAPWTHPVSLDATKTVSTVLWPGEQVRETVHFSKGKGNLLVSAGTQHWSVPVKLSAPLAKPSLLYRLTRGF